MVNIYLLANSMKCETLSVLSCVVFPTPRKVLRHTAGDQKILGGRWLGVRTFTHTSKLHRYPPRQALAPLY